jgi:hypothetical protein
VNQQSDTVNEANCENNKKKLEYEISTFHLFTDFKAAYDTINKEKLLEVMK